MISLLALKRRASKMKSDLLLLTLALTFKNSSAFLSLAKTNRLSPSSTYNLLGVSTSSLSFSSETPTDVENDQPRMNPSKPSLPELKGDYDWDAEYAADPDWITENVPGKIVLNEVELAAQITSLSKLEEGYRKIRLAEEYEDARIIGWVPQAEMYNGRFAMFFLVVGLLTEYWTGISIPGQIEEMARVGGFIGPDF